MAQTRRIHGHGSDARHIGQFLADFAGHFLLLDVPLFPGHQAHDQERIVLLVAEPDDGEQAIGDALIQIRQQRLFHLAHVVIGVFHR